MYVGLKHFLPVFTQENSFQNMQACYVFTHRLLNVHGHVTCCVLYVHRKKLSTYAGADSWNHTHNFVAKAYMEQVDRDVYFQDVKLQMDAKLWGEEYSRHNPPKKVGLSRGSFYNS